MKYHFKWRMIIHDERRIICADKRERVKNHIVAFIRN